jgi:hypothetical protein
MGKSMAAILSGSALTTEPFVLKSKLRGVVRNTYAKVVYLCSRAGMEDGDMAALIAKMAAAEMSVIVVAGRGARDGAGAAPAASPSGVASRISRVSPPDIEEALKEAVL